jgi:hypothetical protein
MRIPRAPYVVVRGDARHPARPFLLVCGLPLHFRFAKYADRLMRGTSDLLVVAPAVGPTDSHHSWLEEQTGFETVADHECFA